eukprot:PITA_01193
MNLYHVKLVLGVLGNATSLAVFLSPLQIFWGVYKLKSTQEFSGLPYVCTLFDCAMWLLYGTPYVKPNSILIVAINGVGFVLESVYLVSYLIFATKEKKGTIIRLTIAMSLAFVIVVIITLLVLHTHSARELLVGTVGVMLSIAMYASPLSVMRLVIRTKSVEYMPFLLSLFNFINAIVWLCYSVVTRDIFIAVPNCIGCVCGAVQLGIYGFYRKYHPKPVTSANKIEVPLAKIPMDAEYTAIVFIQKIQEDEEVIPKVFSPKISFNMVDHGAAEIFSTQKASCMITSSMA